MLLLYVNQKVIKLLPFSTLKGGKYYVEENEVVFLKHTNFVMLSIYSKAIIKQIGSG